VRAVLEAAAAVEAFREGPKGPTVCFEWWREVMLGEVEERPELKPRRRKKGAKVVEQNTRPDEPVSPGVAAPAEGTDASLGPDDNYDPNEPNVDPLVEQTLKVIITVQRARAAFHAAEDALGAAAGAGGCAVREVLEALQPGLGLAERAVGLVPHDPFVHGPTAAVTLDGTRYHLEPPAVPCESLAQEARRLRPIPHALLTAAQLQGQRAGVDGADGPSRGASGKHAGRTCRRLTVQEVDQRMRMLVLHPDRELRQRFLKLTRKEWAELLGVTEATIRETETWQWLQQIRAGEKQRQAEKADRSKTSRFASASAASRETWEDDE
jgi:hypothetical protein